MFRRLKLRNYRSIEDAEVTLGPFGLLVGPNGSGKSNVADAFVFARDLAIDASMAVSSRGGITSVRRWGKSRPFDIQFELRIAETEDALDSEYLEHTLTIGSGADGAWHFKKERLVFEAEGDGSWAIDRAGTQASMTGSKKLKLGKVPETTSVMFLARQILQLPSKLKTAITGVRRYRLNPEAMRQPQLVTEANRLTESGINIATAVRRLTASGQIDAVIAPMRQVVPGLRTIEAIEAGRHLMLNFVQRQGEGSATFSASEISEGALRALGVIVAATQMSKRELIIIEEPEANVHAGAARLVFDVLKEASSRGSVLLTTHSPELLDAAQDEAIFVCSYADGITRVGPLAETQRALVREGLFRLAELVRTEPLRIEGDEPAVAEP